MSSARSTRIARTAQGKCAACLRRRATTGHSTCRACRTAIAEYSATRYTARRNLGLCVQCGRPSDTYLCEDRCAPARRKRRMREA